MVDFNSKQATGKDRFTGREDKRNTIRMMEIPWRKSKTVYLHEIGLTLPSRRIKETTIANTSYHISISIILSLITLLRLRKGQDNPLGFPPFLLTRAFLYYAIQGMTYWCLWFFQNESISPNGQPLTTMRFPQVGLLEYYNRTFWILNKGVNGTFRIRNSWKWEQDFYKFPCLEHNLSHKYL